MDKKLKAASIASCAAFIALAMAGSPACILPIPAIVGLAVLDIKGRDSRDAEASALLGVLSYEYSRTGSALASLRSIAEKASKDKKNAAKALRASIMSPGTAISRISDAGKDTRRVLGLAIHSAYTGADISSGISILQGRLSAELSERRKSEAASRPMEFVGIAGIAFFFPMFSGISTDIVSSYLLKASLALPLKIMSLSYVLLMLLLGGALKNPAAGVIDTVYSIMPAAAMATAVMLLSSAYVSSIL